MAHLLKVPACGVYFGRAARAEQPKARTLKAWLDF